ncbi:FemAB family XrtA/PEP-CTERM system-associated protein [Salinisphaera orenii]|uniref:Peptidoglycan bridge formation protein FemAB n=1 Tax=Salinisphaera orenii YIM 95161 TaxID=1051139 RepID=A0A423Q3G0_9GAMM|nr:FemAB family XrtA/PEP-CTERM system-associated protein [Salinisphaera halophila]ROO33073.1 peptidoglycan bridge formation protein FemAB [Salinisphaera halophila YIM 95161]
MTASTPVVHVLDTDTHRWDAFVAEAPDATFFHQAGWKRVIEGAFGHRCHFLYAETDGRIEGVLPLVHVKSRLFANALISTPFCVYGGALAATERAEAALYAHACELARRLGVDYLEARERTPRHADWHGKDLYYTFRREIAADDEANLQVIPRKQRAVVRKAMKLGMAAEIDSDVERLYPLYAYSLRNLGTPVFSKKYMTLLLETFGDAVEVLTITHEGEPVASVLSFYFRDEVLPYYAGAGERARELKANDYLYWALMSHAAARGVRVFDFGRSKRETGPFHFKRHWGFEPQPLAYEYYLVEADSLPDLSPANPRYQRVIRAWQKLPIPVTRVIGPLLSRNLG